MIGIETLSMIGLLKKLVQHAGIHTTLAALKSEASMVTRLRHVVMHANPRAFSRAISATRFATTASNSYILSYDSTQERSQH